MAGDFDEGVRTETPRGFYLLGMAEAIATAETKQVTAAVAKTEARAKAADKTTDQAQASEAISLAATARQDAALEVFNAAQNVDAATAATAANTIAANKAAAAASAAAAEAFAAAETRSAAEQLRDSLADFVGLIASSINELTGYEASQPSVPDTIHVFKAHLVSLLTRPQAVSDSIDALLSSPSSGAISQLRSASNVFLSDLRTTIGAKDKAAADPELATPAFAAVSTSFSSSLAAGNQVSTRSEILHVTAGTWLRLKSEAASSSAGAAGAQEAALAVAAGKKEIPDTAGAREQARLAKQTAEIARASQQLGAKAIDTAVSAITDQMARVDAASFASLRSLLDFLELAGREISVTTGTSAAPALQAVLSARADLDAAFMLASTSNAALSEAPAAELSAAAFTANATTKQLGASCRRLHTTWTAYVTPTIQQLSPLLANRVLQTTLPELLTLTNKMSGAENKVAQVLSPVTVALSSSSPEASSTAEGQLRLAADATQVSARIALEAFDALQSELSTFAALDSVASSTTTFTAFSATVSASLRSNLTSSVEQALAITQVDAAGASVAVASAASNAADLATRIAQELTYTRRAFETANPAAKASAAYQPVARRCDTLVSSAMSASGQLSRLAQLRSYI